MVTTSPRLIFGVNENDHSLDSPLKDVGDNNLALYVEAQDEANVVDNHPGQTSTGTPTLSSTTGRARTC